MMRLALLLVLLWLPGLAAAATFERCTKAQIAQAADALDGARALTVAAAGAVADTPEFGRWFGRWDADRAADVRETYLAIDAVLGAEALHVVCPPVGLDGCTVSVFANVWAHEAFRVNLCPAFFGMPGIAGVVEGSFVFETGTREGTIIHEVSHFDAVAATSDHCYGRTDCTVMARRDPDRAVRNADSFQYFAEDLALAGR
jgi:peptidyl-Lys metalloendopeptidase